LSKKVFHFGCSFTQNFKGFGVESLFKEFDYKNFSEESSGNYKIFKSFKENIQPNSIAIIQWSSLTRPTEDNFDVVKISDNPLYDLLEFWYRILEEVQRVSKVKNIKVIHYIGWAHWKDKELNDYHRNKLKSFNIIWFSSKKTLDLIESNCFQFQSPTEWSSSEKENGTYLWDSLEWGGMAEWIRENVEIENRYVGYSMGSNHFDVHPSRHATIRFIKEVLLKKLNE
jgi:hypothetical protein